MADDDRPSWSLMVWLGLFAGIAFGAVAVMLLRERRGQGQLGGTSPINIWNMGPGAQGMVPLAPPPGQRALSQSPEVSMETRTKSYALSPRSNTRLHYAAGNNPWSVHVTVGGPPGSFAYISTDPSALNPGFNVQPDVAGIAAGSGGSFRLQPGQDLYAVSNVPDVVVSIIASQEPWPPSMW